MCIFTFLFKINYKYDIKNLQTFFTKIAKMCEITTQSKQIMVLKNLLGLVGYKFWKKICNFFFLRKSGKLYSV